jgi:hypothetical protein
MSREFASGCPASATLVVLDVQRQRNDAQLRRAS